MIQNLEEKHAKTISKQPAAGNSTDPMLWYRSPASVWEEALPIGNGKLGGMVFGGTHHERIALNEDSMWYGGPRDRNNLDALPNLPKLQQLLREGRLQEAQALAVMAMSGVPESSVIMCRLVIC
ncbi:glycoside hydrolase N-terminal domain-containing protein [Paenibacillus sp. JCM 10914]|uniref:glycoside hydrolase N-terminal domain-containing protein n=1 Tax=Paenibacillus sp. JCM 10914 TaxID=1236974 RepID=UPI0003CC98D7|nr:glycoside hydrolase N-terminal domain-containing protein [Paenibacillus sp. JCM 10914]GAE05585.1 putative large secreted protein [Paenibacillus sp. JCM 10914]